MDTTLRIDSIANGTGSGTTAPLRGLLYGIFLNFHASAAGTTDTTVTININDGASGSVTVLTVTDSATDAYKQPRLPLVDASNSALAGLGDPFLLTGQTVTITLAGVGGALTNALVATLFILE